MYAPQHKQGGGISEQKLDYSIFSPFWVFLPLLLQSEHDQHHHLDYALAVELASLLLFSSHVFSYLPVWKVSCPRNNTCFSYLPNDLMTAWNDPTHGDLPWYLHMEVFDGLVWKRHLKPWNRRFCRYIRLCYHCDQDHGSHNSYLHELGSQYTLSSQTHCCCILQNLQGLWKAPLIAWTELKKQTEKTLNIYNYSRDLSFCL